LSEQVSLSRRALFGFLRKKEQPAAPAPVPAPSPLAPEEGFSLDAFYAARERTQQARSIPAAGRRVRVRPQACLAWQGSFCSTCSERCPVEGAIESELGRPRVVESRCDGCGLCVRMCPAPINAFEFLPASGEGTSS
jgi:ferredoxin